MSVGEREREREREREVFLYISRYDVYFFFTKTFIEFAKLDVVMQGGHAADVTGPSGGGRE